MGWEKCPDQKESRYACKEGSSKPLFHSNSVAFLRVGSGYNPRMRTGVLTALAVSLLSVSMPAQSATQAAPRADRVLVLKKERTLELLRQGKVIKSYKVALGGDPVGPKTSQGDHKTPEGLYVLDYRNAHSKVY
jgi:murein L,D-transpeptidase YafK